MIKAISVREAQKILEEHGYKVTVARIEMGLRQRVYPFGEAVEMKGGSFVYAGLYHASSKVDSRKE